MIHTAGLFLMRKDNRFLIGHPTNNKPNLWGIPKGQLDENEVPLEAAFREMFEETNLNLKGDINFDIYPLKEKLYKNNKKILHPFLLVEKKESTIIWDDLEIKCNSKVAPEIGDFYEMDDFKWITLDDARLILHQTQIDCLDEIYNILNNSSLTSL